MTQELMSSPILLTQPFRTVALLAREPGLLVLKDALLNNPLVRLLEVFTHGSLPKREGGAQRPELKSYESECKAAGIPLRVLDLPEARNLERYLPGESFDLMLALSWRYILSKNVLDRPTAGAINLHRGELPKFKGAEPVRRAIEAGATSVSITAHRMTEELDSGPIVATVSIEMPPLPANITAEDYAEKIKVALYPLYAPLARLSILSLTSARQAAAKSYS